MPTDVLAIPRRQIKAVDRPLIGSGIKAQARSPEITCSEKIYIVGKIIYLLCDLGLACTGTFQPFTAIRVRVAKRVTSVTQATEHAPAE